jgi:hypothetical protein
MDLIIMDRDTDTNIVDKDIGAPDIIVDIGDPGRNGILIEAIILMCTTMGIIIDTAAVSIFNLERRTVYLLFR